MKSFFFRRVSFIILLLVVNIVFSSCGIDEADLKTSFTDKISPPAATYVYPLVEDPFVYDIGEWATYGDFTMKVNSVSKSKSLGEYTKNIDEIINWRLGEKHIIDNGMVKANN